jgi:hypothetical protein
MREVTGAISSPARGIEAIASGYPGVQIARFQVPPYPPYLSLKVSKTQALSPEKVSLSPDLAIRCLCWISAFQVRPEGCSGTTLEELWCFFNCIWDVKNFTAQRDDLLARMEKKWLRGLLIWKSASGEICRVDPKWRGRYTRKSQSANAMRSRLRQYFFVGAPSFNGRTSDSDSLDRGSNPWGATIYTQ